MLAFHQLLVEQQMQAMGEEVYRRNYSRGAMQYW